VDLKCLDFRVWGYMKDLVYGHRVDTYEVIISYIIDMATHVRNRHSLLHYTLVTGTKMCIKFEGTYFERLLQQRKSRVCKIMYNL
jgi:hypothetical protein